MNYILLSENHDLHCILIDIKNGLDKIELTPKQQGVIRLFMLGYPIQEIADKTDFTRSYISKIIKNVCHEIQKELVCESEIQR